VKVQAFRASSGIFRQEGSTYRFIVVGKRDKYGPIVVRERVK
jgi:hypothetical protein